MPHSEPGPISVVIPVYGSREILPELVARLALVLDTVAPYEVVFVCDDSPDGAWEVLRELRDSRPWIRTVNLSRNAGQHNALLCGIRLAQNPIIITMDDDLQHPPEEIPKLLEALTPEFDVVYGTPDREQHSLVRRVASNITKRVLEGVMGAETARKTSAFRAFRAHLKNGMGTFGGPFANIDVMLTWGSARFTSVPVRHAPRHAGQSGYSARKLIRHALNMATGFSTLPLRLASLGGFLFMGVGFGLLAYVVGRYVLEGVAVPGFAFLASSISLFSGVQLFALGIIGEYLARMHFRMMDRPTYVVRPEVVGQSSSLQAEAERAETTPDKAAPAPSNPQRVRFTRPFVTGRELEYLRQVLDAPETSGNGSFARRCEELLESALDAARVLMTPSCTHALELSALLLDVKPGDEIIVPTFTFTSTANAYALYGATPVFADVRPDTLNLDESSLPDLLTERTKAAVPVHYAGVACEMDAIQSACDVTGAAVVEDNAHGLFARKGGRPLGTLGDMAALSFHDTKNFSAGEGGALVLNRPELEERAEVLREKGTNRASFFRGEVDKYTWVGLGSSLLPSEFQMAVLLAQLEARERIQSARRAIWQRYDASLADWATQTGCRTPHVPGGVDQSYHMYYVVLPTPQARTRFIATLKNAGVTAPFHYVPLHLSEQGRRFGGRPGMCPVAESIAPRLVRLPLFAGLSPQDQDRVIESVLAFEPEHRERVTVGAS